MKATAKLRRRMKHTFFEGAGVVTRVNSMWIYLNSTLLLFLLCLMCYFSSILCEPRVPTAFIHFKFQDIQSFYKALKWLITISPEFWSLFHFISFSPHHTIIINKFLWVWVWIGRLCRVKNLRFTTFYGIQIFGAWARSQLILFIAPTTLLIIVFFSSNVVAYSLHFSISRARLWSFVVEVERNRSHFTLPKILELFSESILGYIFFRVRVGVSGMPFFI